jgi:hypothetical protein
MKEAALFARKISGSSGLLFIKILLKLLFQENAFFATIGSR